METPRFLLSTGQHETLLALEHGGSLAQVAHRVRRDASVVSRALSAIARRAALVEKHAGQWRITPLGRELNRVARAFLTAQRKLIEQQGLLRLAPPTLPALASRSALLLMGTQLGFLSARWGTSSNPDAPSRAAKLLEAWRRRREPVVFCQHLSREKGSPLADGTRGCEFIPELTPRARELVVRKHHNSAFAGTDLEARLKALEVANVVLAGFTTNHCVDSTARSAFDRGFRVFVVSDAVAAFDRIGPDGTPYPAAMLQAATLAILHQEYATVLEAAVLLAHLDQRRGARAR